MQSNPTDPQELRLIDRARKGETAPFNDLVLRYQDRLFNGIYRMVGNLDDTADIVQETFLRAFRSLSAFRGDSSFYTWIYSIAINSVISERRRQTNHPSIQAAPTADGDDPASDLTQPADNSGDPGKRAQQDEAATRIHQAIQSLDEESRTVVVLRDIDGCDYDQIAEILGLPVGTVKSRLHRARLLLREKLSDLVQ